MASKVALIFVFNHKYDKNIDILEGIYKHRFSNIFHLVPFYTADRTNVIPVYENSHYFQGYFAQGFKSYFNEEFEHYIFIGDDLILNPAINESNYDSFFQLQENASFIPEIFNLHNLPNNDTIRFMPIKNVFGKVKKWYWYSTRRFINYRHGEYGVENANEMPNYEKAEEILRKHGYEFKPLSYQDLHGGLLPISSASVKFVLRARNLFKKYRLSYPLVGSYSDIVIVPKSSIKSFCHYCGVLASNRLFVEVAIPTALLLASDKVVTEPKIGKRGKIYWVYTKKEAATYEEDMKPYDNKLTKLLGNFPDSLYIHPIKLSRWDTSSN